MGMISNNVYGSFSLRALSIIIILDSWHNPPSINAELSNKPAIGIRNIIKKAWEKYSSTAWGHTGNVFPRSKHTYITGKRRKIGCKLDVSHVIVQLQMRTSRKGHAC